jgi:signal transduction histidine kinase/ActR/RegA family two-component response regulator
MPEHRSTDTSLFKRLLWALQHLTMPADAGPADGLRYWQERILQTILLASISLGLFVYFPSLILSLAEGLWLVAASDTLIYALVIYIFLQRKIPYPIRAVIFVSLSYLLGLVLLFTLGPFGAGPIWIFAFPILTAVLLGLRASAAALIINTATLAGIGGLLELQALSWSPAVSHSLVKWTVISLNFMLLNTVAALSVTAVLKSLDRSLADEKAAMAALARQQAEIVKTNEQLKQEIEEHAKAEDARRKLESQLRQAQKMEAVGTLAGGIAHDFNNILYTIMGFTELTLDELDAEPESRKNLQQVLQAAGRARDLVRQILTFSRQNEPNRQPVFVKPIVKEALKLLRATLPASIEIQSSIESDAQIMGDSTSIHQILMNLCTNAAHAMQPEGGTLRVELSDADLDKAFADVHPGMNAGRHLILTTADTGHGIDEQTMEKIFDPFFTTKQAGEGTGMGLSVVHGIVREFGGVVSVKSEPGRGSAFRVYLPVLENFEHAPETRIESPLPRGTEAILLVDDEPAITQMGRQMLASLGYTVKTENSSTKALERFKDAPGWFDLVITDMTMPEMPGDRLAAELLSIRPDIPIILCTGYSRMVSEEAAASAGIAALCMKPLIRKELALAVRRVLDPSAQSDTGEERAGNAGDGFTSPGK